MTPVKAAGGIHGMPDFFCARKRIYISVAGRNRKNKEAEPTPSVVAVLQRSRDIKRVGTSVRGDLEAWRAEA